MGTDVQNTVERVFFRTARGLSESKAGVYRFEIESMIPSALNRLGDRVADSPDFATMQKTFSVSVAGGLGSLASDCVVRTVAPPRGYVRVNGVAAQWLPSFEDLELGGRPTDWLYYTVRGASAVGGGIYIYSGLGVAQTVTASVVANAYPSESAGAFVGLPTQFQDDLVAILVSMVQEKMGMADQVPPSTGVTANAG